MHINDKLITGVDVFVIWRNWANTCEKLIMTPEQSNHINNFPNFSMRTPHACVTMVSRVPSYWFCKLLACRKLTFLKNEKSQLTTNSGLKEMFQKNSFIKPGEIWFLFARRYAVKLPKKIFTLVSSKDNHIFEKVTVLSKTSESSNKTAIEGNTINYTNQNAPTFPLMRYLTTWIIFML